MKKINLFARRLAGGTLALAVVLLAMQADAEDVPQVIQVVRVKGNARYSLDRKIWHDLKQGDIFQPGIIIQTAAHSSVDIQMVDRSTTGGLRSVSAAGNASPYVPPVSALTYSPEQAKANIVRIFESSVLAVDKLSVERTSVDEVTDTQLDLQAGEIMGNVKKLSAASKYEIKIPNGVAGIRGSFYFLPVSGALKMLSGSAILALIGQDGAAHTYLINAFFGFNPNDGTIYPLSLTDRVQPPDFTGLPPFNGGPPQGIPYCPPPYSPVR